MLVPCRRSARSETSSRMMRRMCARPFFGGTNFSIRSVKRISPTLSLFLMAEKASTAQISAAISFFIACHGAELPGAAEVHDEHDGQLPLLLEDLDEGVVEAGGDVPVDRPDVVAVLVLPHLGELHPAPLEDAVVFPGEDLVDDAPGLDLDLPDLLQQLSSVHSGGLRCAMPSARMLTGLRSCSGSPATICSEVTSSASAS